MSDRLRTPAHPAHLRSGQALRACGRAAPGNRCGTLQGARARGRQLPLTAAGTKAQGMGTPCFSFLHTKRRPRALHARGGALLAARRGGRHLAEGPEVEVQREADHTLDLAQAAAAVLLEALQVHLRAGTPLAQHEVTTCTTCAMCTLLRLPAAERPGRPELRPAKACKARGCWSLRRRRPKPFALEVQQHAATVLMP